MKRPNGRAIPSVSNLAAYDAVVRHHTVTAAARSLSLTQSAVSKQIAELQDFLGVALLLREKGKLIPTREGLRYLARIRPALAELEDATMEMRAGNAPGGHFNLSVPGTFGNMWLMPRLADFAQAHPDVVINMFTNVGKVTLPAAHLDAAIMYVDGALDEGLWCQPVIPVTVYPVCLPALADSFDSLMDALKGAPLLTQHSTPGDWAGYCAARALPMDELRMGPRYALLSMGLQAATAGLGIALLPDFVIADSLRKGSLCRLDARPYSFPGGYCLVSAGGQRHASAMDKFATWLRTQPAIEQLPGDARWT